MSVLTPLGFQFNTNAGVKTVTATPAVGDMIVVLCCNSGRTVVQPPTITDDQGGTYAEFTAPHSTMGGSTNSQWIFARTALVASAVSTAFTMTPTATDTGGGLEVYSLTQVTKLGAALEKQSSKQNNQTTGTPSVVMPAAINRNNPVILAGMANQGTAGLNSPPTGWTESKDIIYVTPSISWHTAYISSGETLTTLPWSAFAAATTWCAMVIELDAYGPSSVDFNDRRTPRRRSLQRM